jgi:hypothetical protein
MELGQRTKPKDSNDARYAAHCKIVLATHPRPSFVSFSPQKS